jgi:hypothetical protein
LGNTIKRQLVCNGIATSAGIFHLMGCCFVLNVIVGNTGSNQFGRGTLFGNYSCRYFELQVGVHLVTIESLGSVNANRTFFGSNNFTLPKHCA